MRFSVMFAVLFGNLLPAVLSMAVALKPGDTVAVFGASGNVGKLVASRLADTYKVRAISRSAAKAKGFLGDKCEVCEVDLNAAARGAASAELEAALAGVNAVVICTGTTAFPTKAWSKNQGESVTMPVLSALFESSFDKDAAIAKLDADGFNTPKNIDERANLAILEAWKAAAGADRKRCVLMSSIGVQRRDQMPFPILNTCGVLSAKSAAETALKADAAAGGYAYTVVRPGQLFGGPYDNNVYLGTLFQLDKDKPQDVELAMGDTLLGDTLRSTLAEVIAQTLESGAAMDTDFAVVNVDGTPPSVEALRNRLGALA
jgi:nucleoside-diphosphate-sugar epimerase